MTWKVKDGRLTRSPVETFVLLDQAIARHADRYRARGGVLPTYEAGVHCGPVATAEVDAEGVGAVGPRGRARAGRLFRVAVNGGMRA